MIYERAPILVDMDGVLADFDAEVLTRMRRLHPHIPLLTTRHNFYVSDDYPEHKELIRDISCQPGFFTSLPVIEGALRGWEQILKLGYDPQICTSPIRANPTSREEKLAWLDREIAPTFGMQIVDRAIVTSDKHLHNGMALIDDRPVIENEQYARWQHIVFDQPYNQGGDKMRLYTWHDENLGPLLDHSERLYRALGHGATS